jgi:hypothetical protein
MNETMLNISSYYRESTHSVKSPLSSIPPTLSRALKLPGLANFELFNIVIVGLNVTPKGPYP